MCGHWPIVGGGTWYISGSGLNLFAYHIQVNHLLNVATFVLTYDSGGGFGNPVSNKGSNMFHHFVFL